MSGSLSNVAVSLATAEVRVAEASGPVPDLVTRRRLDALTSIRFFAAVHVVAFHYAGALSLAVPAFAAVAALGYYSVSLFYVLSGFVLIYSYTDLRGRLRGSRVDFWKGRILRLYPAYLLAFFLCIPGVIQLISQHHTTAVKSIVAAGGYLLMLQSWHPRLASFWNYPGWSISVEAFFYIAFPFLVNRMQSIKVRQCWIVIFASGLASALIYVMSHRIPNLDTNELWSHGIGYNPLLRLPAFITGLAIGKLYLLRRESSSVSVIPVLSALVVCCSALAASTVFAQLTLRDTIVVPAYGYLIYSLAMDRSFFTTLLSWRPLVLLGNASYAIYILQWPVFSSQGLYHSRSPWVAFSMSLLLLIAMSVGFYLLIEEPFRRATRIAVKR
jgi:peptidoglycan/LPS O-acetylase OafA/YrhL